MSPSFFISYRRDDNKDFTYRIGDKFKSRYGEQNVFIDFNMEAGIDFHQELTKRVKEGDVLIVVIGVRWLELLKEKAFKQDWVRTEIEVALENNRIVVPICLEDAQLPLSDDLPDSLKPLLRLNAKRLRSDDTFGAQIESIFKDIDVAVKRAKKDENPPLRDNLSKFLDVFDLADTDQKLEERYAQARKKLIDAIFEGKTNRTIGSEVLRLLFVDYFLRTINIVFVFKNHKSNGLLQAGAYAKDIQAAAVTLVRHGTREFHCEDTPRGLAIGELIGFETLTPDDNPVYETIANGAIALELFQGDIKMLIKVASSATTYEKMLRQSVFYLTEQNLELKTSMGELKSTANVLTGRAFIKERLGSISSTGS